ncbi:hypothetical protein HOLleu_26988 [Holothuria leucospilota]|uniref:Uncharacterized protein n=1 Tax=Holothuria leucospilota TaxID=206669 RepID=A0A9Q1H0H8_HOLLE|nr:hypothetical protein HOLleu_26988 [Holothuria leucospilota]
MTSTSFVHVPLDLSNRDEKQSKLTDEYSAEYEESNRNSQPHIYNEAEKDKNLNSLVGDYHEPSNIPTGPYEITDIYSRKNEKSGSYSSVPSSTSSSNKGNVNIAYEDVDMNRTSGEIVNVVYEGYDQPIGQEAPYAVLDPDGEKDSDGENN